MSLLTPEIAALRGASVTYVAPEPFGAASIRYFALAIGDQNPLYLDESFAKAHGYPGVIAPPTLICETNQYANLPKNGEGYAGHYWEIQVPNTRQVRAGNSYAFYQPVTADDIITATWAISDITERTTSKGLGMMTMISTAEYRNQRNELLCTNREMLMWVEIAGEVKP